MKPIKIAGACLVLAFAIGATFAMAANADVPSAEVERSLSAPLSDSIGLTAPSVSPLVAKEIAVLTNQGISATRAWQALDLQGKVAQADLIRKLQAAMGSTYAGVWFENAMAQLYVGATSPESRRTAELAAAQAGLAAAVAVRSVRSTSAQLLAAQNQWNRKLAGLFARGEVTTGVEPQRNAVSIRLSGSVPSSQRAALMREAAVAAVNVFVTVTPGPQLGIEQLGKTECNKFEKEKENANCNPSITAGVRIQSIEVCTAGPAAIPALNKKERVLLTAGHCIENSNGEGEAWEAKNKAGVAKKIGKAGKFFNGGGVGAGKGDFGEIAIEPAPNGLWQTGVANDPVLAVTAEWKRAEETSYPVKGERPAVVGNVSCHEGQTTGESCGEVKKLNEASEVAGSGKRKEGLVRVEEPNEPKEELIGDSGDSGGPFLFVSPEGNPNHEALMEGTLSAGEGAVKPFHKLLYEPLRKPEMASVEGSLDKLDLELLTTANENRQKEIEEEEEKVATPSWSIGGTRLVAGKTHNIDARAVKAFVLKNAAGTVKIECSGLTAKGAVLLGSKPGNPGKDDEITIFSGCKLEGNGASCHLSETEGGATTSTVITTNPVKSEQVENVESGHVGKRLLEELFPATKASGFVKLDFGGECTLKSTVVAGQMVAEAVLDSASEGAIELGQTPQQRTSWLLRFPSTPITSVWLISGGVGKEQETEETAFNETAIQTGTALLLLASTKFEPEHSALWSPLP
jgi:hypothetical protein